MSTRYDIRADFTTVPLGPFIEEHKEMIWTQPPLELVSDFDPDGLLYEIVEDDRFDGGRACRMKYAAGEYGMGKRQYYARVASPQNFANLEFTWLFETGFDLTPPNAEKLGGGKIGPCIQWGPIGGNDALRGTRAMMWWNGNGSHYEKSVFSPSCQDQRSGSQWVQPVVYTEPVECDRLYRFRIQIKGGEAGYARYWKDDTLIATVNHPMHQSEADDVFMDAAFFAGGGAVQAPRWDSFARHGNIRFWSSEDADEITPPPEEDVQVLEITGGIITVRRLPTPPINRKG